jgi:hypothetical protein
MIQEASKELLLYIRLTLVDLLEVEMVEVVVIVPKIKTDLEEIVIIVVVAETEIETVDASDLNQDQDLEIEMGNSFHQYNACIVVIRGLVT